MWKLSASGDAFHLRFIRTTSLPVSSLSIKWRNWTTRYFKHFLLILLWTYDCQQSDPLANGGHLKKVAISEPLAQHHKSKFPIPHSARTTNTAQVVLRKLGQSQVKIVSFWVEKQRKESILHGNNWFCKDAGNLYVEKGFSLGRRPETQSYFCYRSKPHLTLEYLTPKPDFVSYWFPHLSLPEAVCHSKYALTFSTPYL